MVNSRQKGKNGENELIRLLKDQLTVRLEELREKGVCPDMPFFNVDNIKRNLSQTRDGGRDIIGIPDHAIEVKRGEVLKLDEWGEQTKRQAGEMFEIAGRHTRPVLCYRQNRKDWKVRMFGSLCLGQIKGVKTGFNSIIELDIDTFTRYLAGYLKHWPEGKRSLLDCPGPLVVNT